MTRKHFRAMADALNSAKPEADPLTAGDPLAMAVAQARIDAWLLCCRRVAGACKLFNGNFSRGTFYEACGMTPDQYPAY